MFLIQMIGGLRGILTGIAFAIAAVLAVEGYHKAFVHPRISREAREGFVHLAELEAEKAKAAELRRQINAGSIALEEHRKRLAASESERERETQELELEIANYEDALEMAGRSCLLDSADVTFILRKPGANAAR